MRTTTSPLATLSLALLIHLAAGSEIRAELTLTFENQGAGPAGAFLWPIFLPDPKDPNQATHGNTASGQPAGQATYGGGLVEGTGYTAQLWVADAERGEAGLTPVVTTTFMTGRSAGLLNPVKAASLLPTESSFVWQARVWENRRGTIHSWAQVEADPTIARGQSLLVKAPARTTTTAGGESFNLHLAGSAPAAKPPPFSGTLFINPDIVRDSDPSAFLALKDTGLGQRTMYDRRVNGWVDLNAFLFEASFDDDLKIEVQVNPEFGSADAARKEALKYLPAIGQLPAALRRDVQTVWLHQGQQPFGGGNNNLLIHSAQAADYVASGILEEAFIHEAAHTSLDASHASAAQWLAAQKADPSFISTYARDNPTREDIAESFLPYLAARYRADRIPTALRDTIVQTIPNRIAYFDAQSFELHPFHRAAETTIKPAVDTPPQDQVAAEGGETSFSVKASGTAPLTYQWLKDGNKIADDERVKGAATATLTIAKVQPSDAGRYSVLISNRFGSVTSEAAGLTLGLTTVISSQPQDLSAAEGGEASFSVKASGGEPLTYQWLKDGNKLVDDERVKGATTAILTIAKVQPSDAGKYSVLISNRFGSITSVTAVLLVGLAPAVTVQPQNQTGILGGAVSFKVTARGADPLRYQWRKDGTDLSDSIRIRGSATETLVISELQAEDAGSYTVAVSNPFGTIRSTAAILTLPTFLELNLPFLIDGPDSVFFHLFNVLTAGTIRAEVQWEGNSRNLSVTLTGRRRSGLPDPTAPYATASGPSPLSLAYDVTADDLRRGTGWRVIIKAPDRSSPTRGNLRLSIPFDPRLNQVFRQERISLRSGDLWPNAALQTRFLGDLAASRAGGLHAVISLRRAVTCDEEDLLERAGLIRQAHLSRPGWHAIGLVRREINLADPTVAALLRNLTPLDPEDKIDPHILVGNYSKYQVLTDGELPRNAVLNGDGSLRLTVLFAPDATQAEILAVLRAEALAFSPITDHAWEVTLNAARLAGLAAHDPVSWIDPGPAPQMADNNNTRAALNVNPVQNVTASNAGPPPVIAYAGLTGVGITAGVQDTGIDATHADLNIVATIAPNALGTHGTHVAGILASSGIQSSQNNAAGNPNNGAAFQWRGMAPQAAIVSSGDLDNGANLLNAIQNNSLDLVNRSQSVTYDGNYDAENQNVDAYIRGGGVSGGTAIPRRLHVYSAGNHAAVPQNQRPANPVPPGGGGPAVGTTQAFNFGQVGYFSLTKQMKNTVIVGNFDSNLDGAVNDNGLSPSSSLGPAYDGRIKPDVVAPGSTINSTGTGGDCVCYCPNNVNGYGGCSGTSMATPAVSGVAGLLLEGWQNTYSTPLGTTIDVYPPLPSTLRALLIQTATDINNNNVRGRASVDVDSDSNPANGNDGLGNVTATAGPDFATGWGFVNAQAAVNLMQDVRTEFGRPLPKRMIQDAVQQGAVREYDFVVNAAGPLRVTLAWDDVEGAVQNPAINPMLVNDLDLELVDPNGVVWYPWQLGQTILDAVGNPLANDAQPPGTAIQVQAAITPINNPSYTWTVVNCAGGPPGCTAWSGTAAGAGPGNVDYIPANALTGNGAWVATTGKDHLNNVEQVFLANVQPGQIGHWKARVIGFDVRQGPQDFSLVGFPYPDLAELVASSEDKVGLTAFNTPIEFTWTTANVGQVGTGGSFQYQVWLSRDFSVDGSDVALVDANQAALGPLGVGATVDKASSVQITQAQADALLGNPAGTTTIDQLVSADVFLLVQVDSGNAVLEHQESNVAFVQLARLADVVLVMDRSGSMGDSVPVSSGNRPKIDLLKDSASLFLDLLRLDAGDELGEVSFANSVTTDFGPGDVLTAITGDNIDEAKNAVSALGAGGATNIRDALQRGLDLITGAANVNHRRVIIFFSDGMRTAGGNPTEAAFLNQFAANGVTIYSVGFGTEGGTGNAGIDVDLLGLLANANPGEPGFFHVTESAVALDKFFVNAVAGAARSEVVVDPEGDILGRQTATVDAVLGRDDSFATFILTWDDPALNLELAVRSPTGLEVNSGNAASFSDRVRRVNRPTYKLMTLRFPLNAGASEDHRGRWTMIIRNPGNATVHYAASVIAETTVRARWHQPRPGAGGSFAPGNPIPLNVSLAGRGGTPFSGARVVVTPTVPQASLGDLLAAARITRVELDAIPRERNGEPLSEPERLYLALLARIGGGNPLRQVEAPSFELTPGRNPGDYVGAFNATRVAGPYTFVARVSGLTPDCEPFQREVTGSVGVTAPADPVRPEIVVGWDDPRVPGGGITVTVTPVLVGGEYLGPGAGSVVTVTPGGGIRPASEIVDNLDGSYSQRFQVVQRGPASFVVSVGGVSFPTIVANTGLPAPIGIAPDGGPNDTVTPVTVFFPAGADLSAATGLVLVAGEKVFTLNGFTINGATASASGQVPSGLAPDLYFVHLESSSGRSPASAQATFRVVGGAGNFPNPVGSVASGLQTLETASSNAEGLLQLGRIARDLRALPVGPTLTEQAQRAAYAEVTDLLRRGEGIVSDDDLTSLRAVLNAAKIDARAFSASPAPTGQGKDIRVQLGHGAAATFGGVLEPGQTTVRLKEGPPEIAPTSRGNPHMAYDITTTARVDPAVPIEVEFQYQETDFQDESRLRVLHFEDGRWVDRTARLDPQENRIVARVEHLSEFVIVEASAITQLILRAVELDLTGAFTVQLEGPPGSYEIQESVDLLTWTRLATLKIESLPISFIDSAAGTKTTRFYRAVRSP